MAKSRIAIIVGSNRRDSINRKLARALAKLGADKFDASFVRIDDLPMFNQDLEGNLPEARVWRRAHSSALLRLHGRC
jgi:chromate reductase